MGDPTPDLAAALAKLQTRLPDVKKTEKGQAGNRETRYADLANISRQILPLLGELGLSFTSYPTLNDKGTFVLRYELMHSSGQSKGGDYPLMGNSPQAHGSAITYARRYTLIAVTGVAPEDDDDAATAQAEVQAGGRTAQRAARQP
ncbi:MAG TPA: ERF family protein, partial [Micromonosporaceae bacterium]